MSASAGWGFGVILLPLLSTLAFYFLARAWQQNRRTDFVWAGFWLGAAQYTYIAARLLPLVVGGFILVELLRAVRRAQLLPTSARPRLAGTLCNPGRCTAAVDLFPAA
jgi:hypothetical protein